MNCFLNRYYRIFLIVVLFLYLPLQARVKIRLAVLDFEAKNVGQQDAEAVTDILRTELFNTGSFNVVERQQIRRILEEQRFQMSGVTSTDEATEIGRMLNVQKIMIGTVTKLGSTYILNTRIVDVETGLVELAEAKECRGGEEMLPGAITELALTISYKVGLEGSIIQISGDDVYIDLGKVDGVDLGRFFRVIRRGDPIVDLEGHIIGTTDEVVGSVAVTKVQDRFSITAVKKRKEPFIKGDLVRPMNEDEADQSAQPVEKQSSKRIKVQNKDKDEDSQPDVPPIF